LATQWSEPTFPEDWLVNPLKWYANPQQLGKASPLASPYFLSQALRNPMSALTAHACGELLRTEIQAAALALWGGPLPGTRTAQVPLPFGRSAKRPTLGVALAAALPERAAFWFTVRPTLNDSLGSLLFALGYFLHRLGISQLWQYLLAAGGNSSLKKRCPTFKTHWQPMPGWATA